MPRKSLFKVDTVVTNEQHRDELIALAIRPGVTLDDVQTWLKEHGYKLSRNAVWNWRTDLRRQFDGQWLANVAPHGSEQRKAMILETVESADEVTLGYIAGFCLSLNLRRKDATN